MSFMVSINIRQHALYGPVLAIIVGGFEPEASKMVIIQCIAQNVNEDV